MLPMPFFTGWIRQHVPKSLEEFSVGKGSRGGGAGKDKGGTLRLNLACCRFLGETESRRFAPDIALPPNFPFSTASRIQNTRFSCAGWLRRCS